MKVLRSACTLKYNILNHEIKLIRTQYFMILINYLELTSLLSSTAETLLINNEMATVIFLSGNKIIASKSFK